MIKNFDIYCKLVIFFNELSTAGTLCCLALVFVQFPVAILIEFLENFLGNLTRSTTALTLAAAFAFATLTALGTRLLFALVFFSKGGG